MNNEHQQDEHQQALDYIAIQRVMSNYCKASDEGIEELMRSVYHEDAYDDHAGMFSGPASEFVDFAMTQSHTLTLLSHHLTTMHVDFTSSTVAQVKTNVVYAECDEAGQKVTLILGRYQDRFEKRNGAWKIADRKAFVDLLLDDVDAKLLTA